uniref:Uncharacterized protein n=1 Tax=Parascaris univalens TaxID=6257 RepID=A0A915A2L2_PARUN
RKEDPTQLKDLLRNPKLTTKSRLIKRTRCFDVIIEKNEFVEAAFHHADYYFSEKTTGTFDHRSNAGRKVIFGLYCFTDDDFMKR